MTKKQNKTAQMEIMGLAIVVILLLVGLMFAIRFIVNKNPSNFRKGFIDSELASNMINTFLDTHSKDCRKLTMKELLQDCSKGYPGIISCNNEGSPLESCNYVQQEAGVIFSKTLEKWNVKYHLLAYTDNPLNPLVEAGNKCQGEKRSETFLVPSAVTISVKLDIC